MQIIKNQNGLLQIIRGIITDLLNLFTLESSSSVPINSDNKSENSEYIIYDLQKKAEGNDFLGRFREIVSDPLNLLINRVPNAGLIMGELVYLHNGLRVPLSGPNAYYGSFSSILATNRGVHEPLEEFVFQEVIKNLSPTPLMLELGAYWGHYSMWLKAKHPNADVRLVEPELQNLQTGMKNFELNGLTGDFIHAFVGKGHFGIDKYLQEHCFSKVDILHSDIQGFEVEMLEDCSKSLSGKMIDFLFISTHSQELHHSTIEFLEKYDYRIEIESDFDYGTTSFDGFVFASNPLIKPIFNGFIPMKRVQIADMQPKFLVDYLLRVIQSTSTDDISKN